MATAAAALAGLGQLGLTTLQMMPPSTGTWAKFWLYLHALAETVAIAFLGESFRMFHVAGIALIGAGIVLAGLSRSPAATPPATNAP